MTFKHKIKACFAFCIMAILAIAMCGCDDLGAYESPEEYYASFGEVVFLGGSAKDGVEYPVKDYFYNEETREDFLTGDDGKYHGVPHSDYVYVAIPVQTDLKMDSIAMYLQSKSDVALYINFYITDKLPKNWKTIDDAVGGGAVSPVSAEAYEYKLNEATAMPLADEDEAETFDDPKPETRIGEINVYLKEGKWNSFTLDNFRVNGLFEKTIQLKKNQYILLQIRNNSGVRDFDAETGLWVDPQSGLPLDKAEITMTNLLLRAVE